MCYLIIESCKKLKTETENYRSGFVNYMYLIITIPIYKQCILDAIDRKKQYLLKFSNVLCISDLYSL